LFTA
jgi:hypothetical protein